MSKIIQFTGNEKDLKSSQYGRKAPVFNFPDYYTAAIFRSELRDTDAGLTEQNRNPRHRDFWQRHTNQLTGGGGGENCLSIIIQKQKRREIQVNLSLTKLIF